MVELAELMSDLGADEALNLDGGGSSTMVARGATARSRSSTPRRTASSGRFPTACWSPTTTASADARRRRAAGRRRRRSTQPTTDSSTSTTATLVIGARHSTGLVIDFFA